MVVTGEGRDAALEDGQLRDPPLEDAPPVPTITTAGATTAVAGEEAEKAQIFEVYQEQVYDPKRAGLYDADDVILFEHVPADVVFEPPPDLAAWLLETSQSIETDKSSGAPPKEGQARVWRPSLPSIALTATLLTVMGLTMRARLRRRARTRREKFAHALDRLDRGWKACAGDPARAPGMCRGHPRDRKVKVEAELVHVRGVMADYLGPDKRCPRELRGEDLAEKLSQRLARLQRAADELQVMLEVKRVIDALDAAEMFREGQAGGGRFSRADDRGLEVRRGEGDGGDVDDGDGDNDGIVQADRLATRAKSARDTPAIDGIARRSRCVFSDELDACCEELDKQEHFATDALKEGLQLWDLEKVDTAMAKLKLLELPDLVSKFQTARRAVWIKIERLRNELNEAQRNPEKADYMPGLARACVKAETFSATGLREYKSAKSALDEAYTSQLRAEAREKLSAHIVTADPRLLPRLTGHLISASASTLLPRELRGDIQGSGLLLTHNVVTTVGGGTGAVSSGNVGSSVGGGERSSSTAEDTVEHPSSDNGGGRYSDGHRRGEIRTENAVARQLPFVVTGAGVETSSGATGAYEPTPPGNTLAEGAVREHMMLLRGGYQSAAVAFNEYKTRLNETREKECSKDRRFFLETERKEATFNVRVAQQEAANSIAARDLKLKRQREEADEREKKRIADEADRKKADDRRRSRRSADNHFFRGLGLTSTIYTAAAIAQNKGMSLSSSTLLGAVWRLVVAECRGGDASDGTLVCDPSSSLACDVACPPTSSAGSGSPYGDLCAIGSGDAVAASSDGSFGGSASADTFWWVVSAAGSAAGAITSAGGSVVGWFLGDVLGLGISVEQCEVYAVLSLVGWLVSLFVVMKVTGFVAGEVQGPVGAAIRLIVFASWVWGRFHEWLLTTSREVLLMVAPAPLLVLAYAGALRWFDRYPEEWWLAGGWDLRPIASKFVPAVVACGFSHFLVVRAS